MGSPDVRLGSATFVRSSVKFNPAENRSVILLPSPNASDVAVSLSDTSRGQAVREKLLPARHCRKTVRS